MPPTDKLTLAKGAAYEDLCDEIDRLKEQNAEMLEALKLAEDTLSTHVTRGQFIYQNQLRTIRALIAKVEGQ